MKISYRGHEIDAHRARSLGGDTLLYFSIFREADGYEVTSGFTTGSDRVRDYIRYLKREVDETLATSQKG